MSRHLGEARLEPQEKGSRQRFWREDASEFCGEEMQPYVALQPDFTALPHEPRTASAEAVTDDKGRNTAQSRKGFGGLFSKSA
jgi:hypothetical protein